MPISFGHGVRLLPSEGDSKPDAGSFRHQHFHTPKPRSAQYTARSRLYGSTLASRIMSFTHVYPTLLLVLYNSVQRCSPGRYTQRSSEQALFAIVYPPPPPGRARKKKEVYQQSRGGGRRRTDVPVWKKQ